MEEGLRVLAVYGRPLQPRAPVKFVQVPLEGLRVARRGSIYLIKLDVAGMRAEVAPTVLEALAKGMREEFGATVIYGAATGDAIYLQVAGSPFSWPALLSWLPALLSLFGIALLLVSVWQVVASVPSWVWATLVTAGALILFGPAIGELILSAVEGARR